MAKNREAFERWCKNPNCRVRNYDGGAGVKHEKQPLPCPACNKITDFRDLHG